MSVRKDDEIRQNPRNKLQKNKVPSFTMPYCLHSTLPTSSRNSANRLRNSIARAPGIVPIYIAPNQPNPRVRDLNTTSPNATPYFSKPDLYKKKFVIKLINLKTSGVKCTALEAVNGHVARLALDCRRLFGCLPYLRLLLVRNLHRVRTALADGRVRHRVQS